MTITPIGIIHSPFTDIKNMPIQPAGAADVEGTVVIDEEYTAGLNDLDSFSHIYLLYHFHKTTRTALTVKPFFDTVERGVFATRAPLRPNHIGMSIVRLVKREKNVLTVRGCDILDGTPLLDIKPYAPQFDCYPDATSGWINVTEQDFAAKRSDERFE